MRGAIAAGHPLTAEAGARVLGEGGNAVDAAVAAALVSWVAESPLTGPGAGGFMLVHRARDRSTRVFDFFVAVPGLGRSPGEEREMEQVDINFVGSTSQMFKIGGASCAVPGSALGLEEAHRAFGVRPWHELFAPAIELARGGVELTRPQAYLHAILDLILRHTEESRALYERGGNRLVAGDRLVLRDLAVTLEALAERGAEELYRGGLARRLVDHVREQGGAVTEQDLAGYRVIRRRPVRADYRGCEFLSNPPPSAGGESIAYGLRLLGDLPRGEPGGAEAVDSLARVMREQHERTAGPAVTQGTTHISVIDGQGNAVALTASTGSGSGVVVPGAGIHLNNMLGEFFVTKPPRAGSRLASMMSPSVVLAEGRPRLVAGSAGSLRLRGAVMQVVVNVIGHGLGVKEAIDRPRVHLEEPHLHCEGGHDPAELDRLQELGWDVTRWRRRNLYFGGAAAVEVAADGTLAAAGDPRRGGAAAVVE